MQTKGIWNYLKALPQRVMKVRVLYGFLKRRSKGKVKLFKKYWFFLISSRPLVLQITNLLEPR